MHAGLVGGGRWSVLELRVDHSRVRMTSTPQVVPCHKSLVTTQAQHGPAGGGVLQEQEVQDWGGLLERDGLPVR